MPPGGSERRPSYDELVAENERLRARVSELERVVEEIRRASKRQVAPFSKGRPNDEPARPGRKRGKGHGHRLAPTVIDREIDVPAPDGSPDCGGVTEPERIADQYQTELPEPTRVTTLFKVHVRRCGACGRPGPGPPSRTGLRRLGSGRCPGRPPGHWPWGPSCTTGWA